MLFNDEAIEVTISEEQVERNRGQLETTIQVETANEFHTGLVAYILGLDPPEDMPERDAFRCGWDTANETRSYAAARWVIRAESAFGRIRATCRSV